MHAIHKKHEKYMKDFQMMYKEIGQEHLQNQKEREQQLKEIIQRKLEGYEQALKEMVKDGETQVMTMQERIDQITREKEIIQLQATTLHNEKESMLRMKEQEQNGLEREIETLRMDLQEKEQAMSHLDRITEKNSQLRDQMKELQVKQWLEEQIFVVEKMELQKQLEKSKTENRSLSKRSNRNMIFKRGAFTQSGSRPCSNTGSSIGAGKSFNDSVRVGRSKKVSLGKIKFLSANRTVIDNKSASFKSINSTHDSTHLVKKFQLKKNELAQAMSNIDQPNSRMDSEQNLTAIAALKSEVASIQHQINDQD